MATSSRRQETKTDQIETIFIWAKMAARPRDLLNLPNRPVLPGAYFRAMPAPS